MNAKELDVYLAGLGKPHDDLVHEGVLSPGSLIEIYLVRYHSIGIYFRVWS